MSDPFINYFADDERKSVFNLAVIRVLLGTYLIWRVLSLNWGFIQKWPMGLTSFDFLDSDLLMTLLPFQKWALSLLLVLFIIGYRTKWVGMFSGLLLAHMCATKSAIYFSGTVESLFLCSYVLILFGLFAEEDDLSIDGFRRTAEKSLTDINSHLKREDSTTSQLRAPKWALVSIGIVYFGAGWGKIKAVGLEWIAAENLQRHILTFQEVTGVERPIGNFLIQFPELMILGNLVTIGAQVTLIVAVLAGWRIGPIVAALLGFHILSVPLLGLRFIDNIFLLVTVLLAWDALYERVATTNEIDLVYDEHCYFCARTLYLFKLLDINRTVNFYSQYDAPDEYKNREDITFEDEMYVFRDREAFGGYWAFRELIRQFRIFVPVVWMMGLSPVAAVGERIYRYVADNRDRYFTCSVDTEEQAQ